MTDDTGGKRPKESKAASSSGKSRRAESRSHTSPEATRPTGIEIAGDVPWGTHMCQFYENKQDLLDILVPYFKAGLEANEFCMWVTSEPLQTDEAKAALADAVEDLDGRISNGQIGIIDYTEWYTKSGEFDGDKVLADWVRKEQEARGKGFAGLRLAANLFWLEEADWESFRKYEAAVDNCLGDYHMLAVCSYFLGKCGAPEIIHVAKNHQFAITRRGGKWAALKGAGRERMEDAFRESEQKYRFLVENQTDMVVSFDAEWRLLYVSPSYCKMFAKTQDELVGSTFMPLMHEDDRESVSKALDGLHNPPYEVVVEERAMTADGWRWQAWHTTAILEHDGRVARFVSVGRDITERKQAQETLRRERDNLRSIFAAIPDGIYIVNPQHDIQYVNPAITKDFGPYEGRKCYEYFHERTEVCPWCKNQDVWDGKTVQWEWCSSRSGRTYGLTDTPILLPDATIGKLEIFHDITERKQAEDQLLESREELAEIFTMSLDLICIADINEATFLKVSPAFTRVLGYDEAELVNHPFSEFIHPDDIEPTRKVVEDELRQGKEVLNFTNRYRRKDGTWCWLEWTSHPLVERGVTFAVAHDVTERKRVQEELKRERDFAETLIETAQTIVLVLDTEGRIVRFNPYMEQLTGYRLDEVKGKDWFTTFLPGNDHARIREVFQRAVHDIQTHGNMNAILTKDGREREIEWYDHVLGNPQGEVVGVLAVGQDVTERRQREEELRTKEHLLAKAQELGRIGTWELDIVNDLLVWTEENYSVFGVPTGTPLTYEVFLSCVHPDDRDYVDREWTAGMKSNDYDIEHRLLVDGTVRWVRERAEVTFNELGQAVKAVGVTQDITERKRLEEQLRQSEKMDAIGQLAGGVAHDFNNQLGGIMNYADLLLAKTEGEELHRYIDAIIRSCTRGKDLTGQLLAFSRKGKYQVVPVNIHLTIPEVVAMLGRSGDRRIAIRQLLEANPPTTTGDPSQLQNVLLNLGLNARDAMPDGGELVFATNTTTLDEQHCNESTFAIVPGDYLRIRVTDSGTGMDEATRAKVFEPFFTTKEEGKGTGMGLASVYGTVVNHHGAIEVDSKVGQGTTMTVFLPLSRQEEQGAVAAGGTPPKVKGSARILMVDDEKSVRESTAALLRNKGYKVVTAKDGGEAVEYYAKSWEHIDLVILDMNMPVMNGRDTFVAMRKINPDIKAILATGYSLDSNAQEILDEGALSHIQKPFHVHDLVPQIEQALDG